MLPTIFSLGLQDLIAVIISAMDSVNARVSNKGVEFQRSRNHLTLIFIRIPLQSNLMTTKEASDHCLEKHHREWFPLFFERVVTVLCAVSTLNKTSLIVQKSRIPRMV